MLLVFADTANTTAIVLVLDGGYGGAAEGHMQFHALLLLVRLGKYVGVKTVALTDHADSLMPTTASDGPSLFALREYCTGGRGGATGGHAMFLLLCTSTHVLG